MSTATVRAARTADVDAIRTIYSNAYRATYDGLVHDDYIEKVLAEYYGRERVTREIGAAPPSWLGYQVVEEDGRLLGAAGGGLIAPGIGELLVIYLDPGERNRGLGTLLLDRITGQVTAAGATEMWVSVVEGNQKGLPFYRAKGFEHIERRPAYGSQESDGVWTWRMRRPLPLPR